MVGLIDNKHIFESSKAFEHNLKSYNSSPVAEMDEPKN